MNALPAAGDKAAAADAAPQPTLVYANRDAPPPPRFEPPPLGSALNAMV